MKLPIAVRIAATLLVTSSSVAGAQLSSRSANGGLFNSLVDWNPVAEQSLQGTGDVRMSPWAANRVQLGTVKPADPNRPWMGYFGHYPDRELADIIGAEHSLRANPIALQNAASRRERTIFVIPERPDVAANNVGENDQGENEGSAPFLPIPAASQQAPMGGVSAADVIVNPEPSVYMLAGVGLVLIALIRRFRMA